uniref:Uncharacterized protein n=1 Tax=Glossina brevipalpis TaxID=37001 RepID=A0A1A9WXY4_9MUSC
MHNELSVRSQLNIYIALTYATFLEVLAQAIVWHFPDYARHRQILLTWNESIQVVFKFNCSVKLQVHGPLIRSIVSSIINDRAHAFARRVCGTTFTIMKRANTMQERKCKNGLLEQFSNPFVFMECETCNKLQSFRSLVLCQELNE